MTVIAFGSVKASPGVTTTMLALAAVWPAGRQLLLVEADPDGGDLAARCSLRLEPGLATAAAAGRHQLDREGLDRHLQELPGGVPVLVAPADPDEAARTLHAVGPRLADVLGEGDGDGDVLVDVGRIRLGSSATRLMRGSDRAVVVSRPRLDELQHVKVRVRTLADEGCRVELLLVGERPYSAEEVAFTLGVPVAGTLPDEPDVAAGMSGSSTSIRRLRRSRLLRTCRDLAERLCVRPTVDDSALSDTSGWVAAVRGPGAGTEVGR